MAPESIGRDVTSKPTLSGKSEVSDTQTMNKKSSSYAERLKTNVSFSQRLNRNILEIALEKSNRQNLNQDISSDDIANVFRSLGIDITIQLEGYQIQQKGFTIVISAWFREGVNIEKYCKDISIRVNEDVRTGLIRPSGKPEVTVTITGLDFNTPDTLVIEYLNKFGKVTNNSVIYSKFQDGPFKDKYTGERKYQVDFSGSVVQMGTYHLLDNSKIRVFYRGNQKTCGRCHKTSSSCLGGGMAKDCEAAGGEKLFLTEHMRSLWEIVGFKPSSFSLEMNECESAESLIHDAPMLDSSSFPPKFVRKEPSERDIQLSDGITIKNIPKVVEDKDLYELLFDSGLPEDHSIEFIHVNRGEKNTWVVIDALSSNKVQDIYKALHYPVAQVKYFGAPIFCNPLRNTTPAKIKENKSDIVNKSPTSSIKNIPGLSKSAQKKALKKAKQKEKLQNVKSDNLTAADFLQNSDVHSEFEFESVESIGKSCSNVPTVSSRSKFFQKSPALESSDEECSRSDKSSGKRLLSPEENLARVLKHRKALAVAKK